MKFNFTFISFQIKKKKLLKVSWNQLTCRESVYSCILILVFLCQQTRRVDTVREWAWRRSSELYISLIVYDPSSSESASSEGRLMDGGNGYLDCQYSNRSSGCISPVNFIVQQHKWIKIIIIFAWTVFRTYKISTCKKYFTKLTKLTNFSSYWNIISDSQR